MQTEDMKRLLLDNKIVGYEYRYKDNTYHFEKLPCIETAEGNIVRFYTDQIGNDEIELKYIIHGFYLNVKQKFYGLYLLFHRRVLIHN